MAAFPADRVEQAAWICNARGQTLTPLRRRVFETHGLFDTSFRIAADYDAILRYFGAGDFRSTYIPQVLVKMRLGGESNRSLSAIVEKSKEDYRALRKNRVGGVATLLGKNVSKVPQFFRRGRSA